LTEDEFNSGLDRYAYTFNNPLRYTDQTATETFADLENMIGAVCSFSADTQVSTQKGPQSISSIEVGDFVLAWNEVDSTLGYYEVTDTFSHADEVLTELIIDGEWIETTPKHPFYVEGKGRTPAGDLQIGDKISQSGDTTGMVRLRWNVLKTLEMYNLTVDTAHTFFVGTGQWLVHNDCSDVWKTIDDGQTLSTDEVLKLGQEFVGDNPINLSSGVYVSSPVSGQDDVFSMLRITDADIAGHGLSPHANFEFVRKVIDPLTARVSYQPIKNLNKHVFFEDAP
jgi:hypothetical protein